MMVWRNTLPALLEAMPAVRFAVEPGYGMAYSGPGGRPRTQTGWVR